MPIDSAHHFLFYSTELDLDSRTLELQADEHHHAARVLRLGPGDQIHLTNGRGLLARCDVEAVGKGSTRLAVVECNEVRPAGPRLDLALACLRKDAFEQAVKQCTELGVDRFVPFASDKSHLSDYGKGFFDRLGRVTLAAMKQSFRTTLPRLEPVCQFEDMVAQSSESGAVVVGDSDGGALEPCAAVGAITIVVGPEGGLNAAEREVLSSAGAEFVSASTHRLRSETSAAALTTLVLASLRA